MPRRTGKMMLGLLALAGVMAVMPQAAAGQARSTFRAVLRIDAGLVRRDLARRDGGDAAAVALAATRAAKGPSAPRVLPRAGGGVCVRTWIGRKRFRWVCR